MMTAALYELEAIVGRPLRQAEQAIDVLGLDAALNQAKTDLEAAVQAEQKRAVNQVVRHHGRLELTVTRAILEPLERLYRLGRDEAYLELQRLGYQPRRAYAAEPHYTPLDPLAELVATFLRGLSLRIAREHLEIDTGDVATNAIARALLQVPGARNIASQAISSALTAGLAQTFEANQDLVSGWEYTSVLDGGTCPSCSELDGTSYPSWDAIQEVLPNGGPNPYCDGGNRCRCRPVPLGPG